MAIMRMPTHRRLLLSPLAQPTRQLSTAPGPSIKTAAEAASYLEERFVGKVIKRKQLIDANQLQKLSLTLGRPILRGTADADMRETCPLPQGTGVPAGHHLVYFTPGGLESELGVDGSDQTFNAPAPFTRRMWAGGAMRFDRSRQLRVGDEAEERTALKSAAVKRSRSGQEMVLVELDKELHGPSGLAVIERRSWIFRAGRMDAESAPGVKHREVDGDIFAPSSVHDIKAEGKVYKFNAGENATAYPIRHMFWSAVALFRFSALTFNAHKIHYSQDWTRTAEGHPRIVVHGPLNVINVLDYWRDVHGAGREPSEIKYQAKSPVYAGEAYQIRTGKVSEDDEHRCWEVLAEKDGAAIMTATIQEAKQPTRSQGPRRV